ncbi:hypothetical protein KC19_1G088200 [Ceratodon purpureus]|uniref:Uncharacterized protein n=1 Tax=Ceratodon purpureus TaxID=3225 RepID=A0A8T0J2Z4_CERPU|nr:hypothetical protein KC19_1G088200 [Ceratodon purpureus]
MGAGDAGHGEPGWECEWDKLTVPLLPPSQRCLTVDSLSPSPSPSPTRSWHPASALRPCTPAPQTPPDVAAPAACCVLRAAAPPRSVALALLAVASSPTA